MTVLEAIRHRRSVRTFDGKPLSPEDAYNVMKFARSIKNPYGLAIEWRLLDAKKEGLGSPVIAGEDMYIAGKMQLAPHAEEAFGHAFEQLVLFAEMQGLGTTWIAGTMNRHSFESAMELSEGEVMPCVSPLGYPAKKMSLRETLMRKGVKADSRFDFEELFYREIPGNPLSPEAAGELREVLEAVRLAPSAVNKQPWRAVVSSGYVHFYELQSKGYVSANGWDLQKVDMGIALCHFEAAAAECGIKVAFELRDPQLPEAGELRYIASYRIGE